MRVDEIKVICSDFSAVRDNTGNITCRYLVDGELCKLPVNFRCVVKDRQNSIEARKEEGDSKVWSYTRVMEYVKCQMSYNLKYELQLKPDEEKKALLLGKMFAAARANILTGKEYLVHDNRIDSDDSVKLDEVLRYIKDNIVMEPSRNEESIRYKTASGITIIGYLDGISTDGKRIYEWKYSEDEAYYSLVAISMQATVYMAAKPEVEEFQMMIAKKAREKQNKNESVERFRERIREKFAESPPVVKRVYLRHEIPIEYNLKCFEGIIDNILKSRRDNMWVCNPLSCRLCDYRETCRDKFKEITKGGSNG